MSERVAIQAEQRTIVGKQVNQLRRQGWVPAVIYGQSDPLLVQVDRAELRRALRQAGLTELIDVQIGADQRTVLARDIQQHVTRGDVLHVDFFEVNLSESITMDVNLVTVGALKPEILSLGSVSLILQSVEVEALPTDLPSEIEVDLSRIQDHEHAIHVRDLSVPEGVKILSDPDTAVTTFSFTRTVAEEEEEEEELMFAPAADAVEVIGRERDEDEDF